MIPLYETKRWQLWRLRKARRQQVAWITLSSLGQQGYADRREAREFADTRGRAGGLYERALELEKVARLEGAEAMARALGIEVRE